MPPRGRTKILHFLHATRDGAPATRASLDAALDKLIDIVTACRGLIAIPGPEGEPRVVSARRLGEAPLSEGDKLVSRHLYAHALEKRAVCLVSPVFGHPIFENVESLRTTARSAIAAPLRVDGKPLGVLMLHERKRTAIFGEEEARDVDTVLDQTSVLLGKLVAAGAFAITEELAGSSRFPLLVGRSRVMRDLHALLELLCDSPSTVLVLGERGTGKELIARSLHEGGKRADEPLVTVNVATLPPNLIDAELFGTMPGAYTGALKKSGLIAQAKAGTLFFDEIGELPLECQAKLLRVLQEKTYRRIGGEEDKKVLCRIVAATNRDLHALAAEGKFRHDLLDRLSGFVVKTPPLRERKDDLPLLVAHLLPRIAALEMRPAPPVDEAFLGELRRRDWQGNIRELETAIRAFVIFSGTKGFTLPSPPPRAAKPAAKKRKRKVVRAITRAEIRAELERNGGNKKLASENLGIPRATLYRRLDDEEPGSKKEPDAR